MRQTVLQITPRFFSKDYQTRRKDRTQRDHTESDYRDRDGGRDRLDLRPDFPTFKSNNQANTRDLKLSNHPGFNRRVTYTKLEDVYNFESGDLLDQYSRVRKSVLKELTSLELNRTLLLDQFTDLKVQKENLEMAILNYQEQISVLQRNIKTIKDEHDRLRYQKPKEVLPVGPAIGDVSEI